MPVEDWAWNFVLFLGWLATVFIWMAVGLIVFAAVFWVVFLLHAWFSRRKP